MELTGSLMKKNVLERFRDKNEGLILTLKIFKSLKYITELENERIEDCTINTTFSKVSIRSDKKETDWEYRQMGNPNRKSAQVLRFTVKKPRETWFVEIIS